MEIKDKKEEFAFFWGGSFSQWARSTFIIDGVNFSCGEQYMMYKKALLFGDLITTGKIMKAKHPREQKKLGRQVVPYDDAKWVEICKDIVYDANVAKFTQNKDMLKELMATKNTTLVESSPNDTRWGIGLAADDPLAQDRKTWQGDNWLGEAIQRVREDIKSGAIKTDA